MKHSIYFNGFWSGFHDKANAVNISFFIKLLTDVYNSSLNIANNADDADILVENTQIKDSMRTSKNWLHTYLFSGESYIRDDAGDYTCVFWGKKTKENIVNVPLYIPYLYSSFDESFILTNPVFPTHESPKNEVLAIISNSNGSARNMFLEKLEKDFTITYAGNYKNNIGGPLKQYYNSNEFFDYIKRFKFIIAMENSEEETYITEKIVHGFLGQTVPIYWGSPHITDYINADRIIEYKGDYQKTLNELKILSSNEKAWLEKVNTPFFTEKGQLFTVSFISKQIRNIVYPRTFPLLQQIIIICNQTFEPERYSNLQKMCSKLGLTQDNVSFICPTYKHTITDEMMKTHVKDDLMLHVRREPTKKSEVSLTLNFKAVLEYIVDEYGDGIFLTLESDVFEKSNVLELNDTLKIVKDKEWDVIHVGGVYENEYCIDGRTPYRGPISRNLFKDLANNELANPDDKNSFKRKFNTRCTDSLLWSYNGCKKFLDYMNKNTNYGAAFDYYMINKCEIDMDFKHYHSLISFFDQASNLKLTKSTIQDDKA